MTVSTFFSRTWPQKVSTPAAATWVSRGAEHANGKEAIPELEGLKHTVLYSVRAGSFLLANTVAREN